MARYQTIQKKMLLEFMKLHNDKAFSVHELSEGLKDEMTEDAIPGESTIYRLMSTLVEEGLVKRFVKGNSRQFLYQMICGEHCDRHLHLKCSECGKLYHMDEEESEEIFHKIFDKHHFCINEGKTILFGRCDQCK